MGKETNTTGGLSAQAVAPLTAKAVAGRTFREAASKGVAAGMAQLVTARMVLVLEALERGDVGTALEDLRVAGEWLRKVIGYVERKAVQP